MVDDVERGIRRIGRLIGHLAQIYVLADWASELISNLEW
jgi:hypothetical protein